MKERLISLCLEGLGKYQHFLGLDGRRFLGEKLGTTPLVRCSFNNVPEEVDPTINAPLGAQGFHMERIEKCGEQYYYIMGYYKLTELINP